MVSVVDAVTGGKLDYGVNMESDELLQEWIESFQLKQNLRKDIREHQGDFLILGGIYQDLATEISVGNGDFTNLQTFLAKVTSSAKYSTWFGDSKLLPKVGELMSQQHNQKLLGLAVASTLNKPLRYCIQTEIKPSANYWSSQSHTSTDDQKCAAVVVVDSSNPVLAISRVLSALLSKGQNVILAPGSNQMLLSCVLMAEIINKAGIPCNVYSVAPEKLHKLAELDNVRIVYCGDHAKALPFRGYNASVEIDADGKRIFAAHETADCDAVVDACLFSLKTSSRSAPGIYLVVQDTLFEDINWRLRDRIATSRSGLYLDNLADYSNQTESQTQDELSKFLEQTKLDTVKVGGATVVFNAQPSMPITQIDRLGQTLLVFTYRSFPELINILNNLKGASELSLWLEQQSLAWHIVNQVQIPRIFLNNPFINESAGKELRAIQHGKLTFIDSASVKTNASLYGNLDGLRAAQRTWMAQTRKSVNVNKLLQLLALEASFAPYSDALRDSAKFVSNVKGTVVESSDKSLMRFELTDSLGAIAIISDSSCLVSSLIRLIVRSLSAGNAVVLCTTSELNTLAQSFAKAAKSAGLPDVILACSSNAENHSAIVKHHGIRHLIVIGAVPLPGPFGSHIKEVWQTDLNSDDIEGVLDFVAPRKQVSMAIGDGLGN